MKILVIDNYDSFTYNLVHLVKSVGDHEVTVVKNDPVDLKDVQNYDRIILSPGPGIPSEAGQLISVIKEYGSRKPILGVCLGHQAIGEVFGGKLINLDTVFHGLSTPINILSTESIFQNLPTTVHVGRYHSWILQKEGFPEELQITAEDEEGMIMAFKHKEYPLYAVQFHPESILTPEGKKMMENWLTSDL